ncbi:MAG: type I methionyl aminopeptidase [Phycisphaerales bacterium]|nr:type I methionyl aminopeptidase [Phycisphaerales bacterium]
MMTIGANVATTTAREQAPAAAALTRGEVVPTSRRVPRAELRSASEIAAMREAGRVVRMALDAASRAAVSGVRPAVLDSIVAGVLAANRAEPVFQGWPGGITAYPSTCCVSVNDALVHGIPGDVPLVDGDVVAIDVGVRMRDWCADGATTIIIGKGDRRAEELRQTCSECLDLALALIRPGMRWSAVAEAMQSHAASHGFALATGFVGHGIGRSLHELPEAPSFVTPSLHARDDFTLLPGMTLAIEPMLIERPDEGCACIGRDGCAVGVATRVDSDGWTVRTVSGARSAHFEHTIVVLPNGIEVLTAPRFGGSGTRGVA